MSVLDEEQQEKLRKALEFVKLQQPQLIRLLREKATSNSVMAVHQMSILSRIYLGNVYFELQEQEIKEKFSSYGAVKAVNMGTDPATHKHKGYCFVEYEVPEAAYMALESIQGVEFGGRSVKIGRPNNFPSDLPKGLAKPFPNRIYIANIHEMVTEEEIVSVFEPFGVVKNHVLVPDKDGKKHKGYGFVEFAKENSAKAAIAHVNGVELAGKVFRVFRTVVGYEMPQGMRSIPVKENTQKAMIPARVLRAAQSLSKAVQDIPTPRIVMLENMLVKQELDDQTEQEIRFECEKYGQLEKVILHAFKESQVRVFLVYASHEDALKAKGALNHRFFGGREIAASYYPKKLFNDNYYDGDPLEIVE